MDKSTPRPWVREPGSKRGAWIGDANGNWAALACGNTDDEGGANAALIVRSTNAYDDLIACREALRELLRCAAIPESWATPARAALLKAEG